MSDAERVVTHPSGWWKARDGRWYRPDEEPASEEPGGASDLPLALAIVVNVIVIGSLTRGNAGAFTLLLGGMAGALLVRWRVFSRMQTGWLTASVALCGTAGAVPLLSLAVR
jgi:hypothetical protein